MDHTEKKEMEEQCSSKNEKETNTSSEQENSSNDEQILNKPEEKVQQEQCSGKIENETNESSEPKEGSTNRLRSMLSVIVSERGLRCIEVLCIAGASLFVSFMSYRTQQLEYMLNLANSKLHVEVYCDTLDLNDDEYQDTMMFGVKYIDGIYEDLDVKCYSVITFTYYERKTDEQQRFYYEKKKIDFIINGYFFTGYSRGVGDYLYARLYEDNWKNYCELSEYILHEQKEYPIASVDLAHYAIISYKNIVGEPEELGYKCGSGGKFNTAEPEQIKQYINGLKRNNEIEVEDLAPEAFMTKVKEFIVDQEHSEEQ